MPRPRPSTISVYVYYFATVGIKQPQQRFGLPEMNCTEISLRGLRCLLGTGCGGHCKGLFLLAKGKGVVQRGPF